MSYAIKAAVRPLQMPATAKAVLNCLADFANDGGECWPSVATISEVTCFCERAVQTAIRWLCDSNVIAGVSKPGTSTRYIISPAAFTPPTPAGAAPHPRSSCTHTPASAAPHPRICCTRFSVNTN